MQAALCFAPTFLPLSPSKNLATSTPKLAPSLASRCSSIKATAATATYDASTVDYNSIDSVFPAEACDVVGGEACLADCYPEVRLKSEATNRNRVERTVSEDIEREYLAYNDAKTVFRAEACDDLGGLFCQREYQRGVY